MFGSILMRLAIASETGTNEDLTLVREPKDDDGTGNGDEDGDEQGEGESGESGDEDGEGESEGDSEGGDDATGNGDGGDSEGGEGYTDGDSGPSDPSKEGPEGAGGHSDLGDDPKAFLEGLLSALQNMDESPVLDGSKALAEVVESLREDDCQKGEAVWRPYNEAADEVIKPRADKVLADMYRKDAKLLTAAMRTMFRRRFLQNRHPTEVHGVKKGIGLSQERLVATWVEVQSGLKPSAPDYDEIEASAPTLAVAVVGDESGSMQGRPAQAAATAMIALAESFDSLGCPVMCCGPRNGRRTTGEYADEAFLEGVGESVNNSSTYHRHHSSRIDLFKDWHESFRQCKDRFGSYTASGGTPLSDGIQYALRALNERTERFRVVVVLTDGEPDYSHTPVVRRQIRLAREAGIHVIGVGIEGAEYSVPALFPDNHIVVEDLQQLPKRMMAAVEGIVFPKKAKKAKFDGKAKRAKARKPRRF